MTLKQLFAHYGTNNLVIALAIGYTEPAIRHWVKKGHIPFKAQKMIEAATGGKLIARKIRKQQLGSKK